jgi:glycosyltransferase involved in cell wall biosynthesis
VHVKRWKWPEGGVRVLTNGIDVRRFAPSAQVGASFRESQGISKETLVLGYVGRWHGDKDVGNLCRALKFWPPSNGELTVIFCGQGLDPRNSLFAQAIAGLGGNVRCVGLGEVPDTSQIMPAFDYLCLCSMREAYPLVLCEALACGVSCIATDVGDCAGIIGDFGLVVPPGDSERMGRALVEYAGVLRSSRVASIRAGARAWAVKAFDEEAVVQRYLHILEDQCLQDRELWGRGSLV